MKISQVRMMRLKGPRFHALGGGVSKIAKVVVRVDADNGQYGLGEIDDFMGVRQGIAYIDEYFRGRDAFAINALVSELLYGTVAPFPEGTPQREMGGGIIPCPLCSPTATPWGPVAWAVSGVEMALCDLVGKTLGIPAYNLLGGRFRNDIRVYLDRSSPENIEDLNAWKEMGEACVAAGFTQAKLDIDFMASDKVADVWNRTVSLAQVNRMVARLSAVRQAVGPDFELCVDCHMQYNVPDAIRVATALAPLNILWLEDPTPILNPTSCAAVRAKSPIPICVGEMFLAEQARLFIDANACDIIHPDVMFCGGMHELQRIAGYAELNHLPIAMHGNGGPIATIAAGHVAAACRNFLGVEYHLIETEWVGEIVSRDVPLFRDGKLLLTDAPGLGIQLNRETCRQYLAPGESLFD